MILLTILILILLTLIALVILGASVLGSTVVIIFGDIIVCIVFIALLIRWLIKRKRK